MSTKVVINESPQYKLSITNGADQSLSITNGIELNLITDGGPQGPAGPVGQTGPAGDSGVITTNTGTTLEGFIYGNGTKISKAVKSSVVPVSGTENTLVERDANNRIHAYQIRLTDGTNRYGQINPPNFQTGDVAFSYQFPRDSGTIALNTTAVMLSGSQVISGNKDFTGNVTVTSPIMALPSSVLNTAMGDSRYGHLYKISPAPINSITTVFAPVVSLTLDSGLYQIDAFIAANHSVNVGSKIRFSTNRYIKVALTDSYGRPSVAGFSWPIVEDSYSNDYAYAVRGDSVGTEFRRTITGIIETPSGLTTLSLDFAQLNLNASLPSTARVRAHILARKIKFD